MASNVADNLRTASPSPTVAAASQRVRSQSRPSVLASATSVGRTVEQRATE